MASARGRSEVSAYMAALPEQIVSKVLRGAGRAAGHVIAEEAKLRSVSKEVAKDIVVKTRRVDDRIVVAVTVKPGFSSARAAWLEYGTAPHFISVDDSQRNGRGVGRINQQLREAGGNGSLVIGGKFVGDTVFHPGARPHPLFRPALDLKEADAIRAAQSHVSARISKHGIAGNPERDDE